jgi:hypothetical protein
MDRATTWVPPIGFGFRDIGVGITITATGSTAITHGDNSRVVISSGVNLPTPGSFFSFGKSYYTFTEINDNIVVVVTPTSG